MRTLPGGRHGLWPFRAEVPPASSFPPFQRLGPSHGCALRDGCQGTSVGPRDEQRRADATPSTSFVRPLLPLWAAPKYAPAEVLSELSPESHSPPAPKPFKHRARWPPKSSLSFEHVSCHPHGARTSGMHTYRAPSPLKSCTAKDILLQALGGFPKSRVQK